MPSADPTSYSPWSDPGVSLASFLTMIVRALNAADIPCMLTGSLAAAYYGIPRATQDIDLILESEPEKLERLLDGLESAGLYVDRETARDALRTDGQFNAIDPSTGWKAYLIIRKAREFSKMEFGRRQQTEIFGVELGLATVEDLIIAKLEWSELGDSELQRWDIRQLLQTAGNSIDESYIHHWIGALGLQKAWERVTG